MNDLPQVSTTTFIGIVVAISGNVLISFALNLQKLAHKRVEQKRRASHPDAPKRTGHYNTNPVLEESQGEVAEASQQSACPDDRVGGEDVFSSPSQPQPEIDSASAEETQPLIFLPAAPGKDYGSATPRPGRAAPAPPGHKDPATNKFAFAQKLIPLTFRRNRRNPIASTLPVEIMTEEEALHGLSNRQKSPTGRDSASVENSEGDYLKSKLWWLGFLLMNIGEVGNFISYAFAAASVVAPLGTFALIANCFFAPLMLGEKFRGRDLLGVLVAIIGAVTVVLASNASDTRLDPAGLLHAILQLPFAIFCLVYSVGVIILATLSESSIGRRWAVVDVGLCALFGGFTVLSTKALSTLLTLEWLQIFSQWITYPLLLVLLLTGVGQIKYLNRALMRFDSKMVIPIQFVLFTLSAIIGSAILYGDFKKAKFHQILTFLYGCAATFSGVFIIAWAPANANERDLHHDAEEGATNNEGIPVPGSPEQTRLGLGTIGRRRRATLILPSSVNGVRESPTVLRKRSAIRMGISPAQHLLLVHTPPREITLSESLRHDDDLRGDLDTELGTPSPESYRRQRSMSWYGNGAGVGNMTRDSSLAGPLHRGYGRVGSLDSPANR